LSSLLSKTPAKEGQNDLYQNATTSTVTSCVPHVLRRKC